MRESEPSFAEYLDEILASLPVSFLGKKELKREWQQHLLDSYHTLVREGLPKEEARQLAIRQFGAPELLRQDIAQVYAAAGKEHFFKELLIWIICLTAAAIGPYILIKAQFSFDFILTAGFVLFFFYFIYHKIIKIIPAIIGYLAVLPLYAFWVYLFLNLENDFSMKLYLDNLFTLDWSRLTGVDGIFRLPTLHLLWYLIIVVIILSLGKKLILKAVLTASFRYWALLTTGFILAKAAPSSEASVLILNVVLIYAFLQQISAAIRLKGSAPYQISKNLSQ
ncbi:MAG: permease prefix domain 1-containing protein [Desulfitobacteriia bacterium]|jgi:hypothetical protein